MIFNGLTQIGKIQLPDEGKLAYALFNLSNGIERILKVIYVLARYDIDKTWSRDINLKKLGHNILKLINSIEKTDQKVLQNIEFFKAEPYQSILSILSDYAIKTRYYNLDYFADKSHQSPFQQWHNQVEKVIVSNHWKTKASKISKEMKEDIRKTSFFLFHTYDYTAMTDYEALVELQDMYKTISKYVKGYLSNIIREFYRSFDRFNNRHAYMLKEFFALFSNDDSFFRSRIDFTKFLG